MGLKLEICYSMKKKKVIGKINYKITSEYIQNLKNYRIVDFEENCPVCYDDFKIKNDDLTNTNENWVSIEIEFHKKVKLIMVDFYDDGCNFHESRFNFKNINKKKIVSHKNNSFETHNIIFNESELLNDMTFLKYNTVKG